MATQWLECRVAGDLINMNEIREINKPSKMRQPLGLKTHEILIEFCNVDAKGQSKMCAIYQGAEEDCIDFFAHLKFGIKERLAII